MVALLAPAGVAVRARADRLVDPSADAVDETATPAALRAA
jgi:hypothetical protein